MELELRDIAAVLVGVVAEEDRPSSFRVFAYTSPVEPRGRVAATSLSYFAR